MKFPFFSSATRHPPLSTVLTQSGAGANDIAADRAALTAALYTVLQDLRESLRDPHHLHRLCDTVLQASPRLRLVWIGFCEPEDETVLPHVVAGECTSETADWRLPQACFSATSPFSQAALESIGTLNHLNSLFSPWQSNMEACTASAALAIPMPAEKHDIRGLIVFYADEVNFFSRLGSAPFQAFSDVAGSIWQQSSLMQILIQKAQLDDLTGLMNRRKITHFLQKSIEHASREKELLSIMLLRIDGFDRINALYGWNAGDQVLSTFARHMALQIRSHDRLGRWTGVEFLYVLPRTDVRHAHFLAHGVHAYFLQHPLLVNDAPLALHLKMGVATYPKHAAGIDDLLRQAGQHVQAAPVIAPSDPAC